MQNNLPLARTLTTKMNTAEREAVGMKCVPPTSYEFIGNSLSEHWRYTSHIKAVEEYMGCECFIDIHKAMFRLEHHDPTLTSVVIGDCFYPLDVPGRPHSGIFDVLDAIYSHPHLKELIFAWDDANSFLWREGNGRDALITVLREKTSITRIEVRTSLFDLSPIGDLLQHCPHLECVKIAYDGYYHSGGYGIGAVIRVLQNFPLLEDVAFSGVQLGRGSGSNLYVRLFRKKSMRWIWMTDTQVDHSVASSLVDRITADGKCEHLMGASFFSDQEITNPPEKRHWQEDIDLDLEKCMRRNRIKKSVQDFMNKIENREGDDDCDSELQFFADMEDANYADYNDEGDPIQPPDHLYALIRSKPDYIKRCVDHARAYPVSNKRPKLN